jgi:hypothetical protein
LLAVVFVQIRENAWIHAANLLLLKMDPDPAWSNSHAERERHLPKLSSLPRVWNPRILRAFGPNSLEAKMGLAEYMIVTKASGWSVLHDGETPNDYATKEAAFEAAAAAASLAIREGHEVRISVPSREAGNKTVPGAKDPT